MLWLITDRTKDNVDYLKELSLKGWSNMTPAEQAEWTGNPITASEWGYESPVNILPNGPYYSSNVELTYRNQYIAAKATTDGIYLYAVAIVGQAADFEGKTLTLSVGSMESTGGSPLISAYWHDDSGYEYAGVSMSAAGSVTFAVTPNTGNREYLALYIYATTETSVSAGASVKYGQVMLENGNVAHEYVPYTPILPTRATKGAYNYSDINRVEAVVAELSERLGLGLETKTDWTAWDVPDNSFEKRYLGNIQKFYDMYASTVELPAAPQSLSDFTHNEANNIETILLRVYEATA